MGVSVFSVYLECCSLVTVIVVLWRLLITGVNNWIAARAFCGSTVAGSRRERQGAGLIFLFIFYLFFYHLGTLGNWRGSRKEKGVTAADKKAQLVVRAQGFQGPYGRQQFTLHFIAHLAVLINGKPVNRAWSSSDCLSLSHYSLNFCCSTMLQHFFPNLWRAALHFQVSLEAVEMFAPW